VTSSLIQEASGPASLDGVCCGPRLDRLTLGMGAGTSPRCPESTLRMTARQEQK